MKALSYISNLVFGKGLLRQSLRELIQDIDDPRKDILLQIYDDNRNLFHYAHGSSHNHQAWDGGYADHIADTLRINTSTYNAMEKDIRNLPFSHASAAIALFFHDIEKPFRYAPDDHKEANRYRNMVDKNNPDWEVLKYIILKDMKEKYGFTFSEEEENALKYTHGEGNDHQKNKRVAGPLAAHVHHCDNASARIWHDKGKGLSL